MDFDVVTEDSPNPRAALRILEGVDDEFAFDVVADSPPIGAKVRRVRPCIQSKADCFALLAVSDRTCEFRDLSDIWASPSPTPSPLLDPNEAGLCLAISHKICRIIGVRYYIL